MARNSFYRIDMETQQDSLIRLSFLFSHKQLVIRADDHTRQLLAELCKENPAEFDSDKVTAEVFEHLLANSELQWIGPEVFGDLTDAPIIGVLGEEFETNDFRDGTGLVLVGQDGGIFIVAPVLQRWGFMDYQVVSPQRALMYKGVIYSDAP